MVIIFLYLIGWGFTQGLTGDKRLRLALFWPEVLGEYVRSKMED